MNALSTISSMTGYGRGKIQKGSKSIEIEIRSLNNKFLDVNVKISPKYLLIEQKIRQRTAARIGRGKVDIIVAIKNDDISEVNDEFVSLSQYIEGLTRLMIKLGVSPKAIQKESNFYTLVSSVLLQPNDFLRKNITSTFDPYIEEDGEVILDCLEKALESLLMMRNKEGQFLGEDIRRRINDLEELTSSIYSKTVNLPEKYTASLAAKMAKLLGGVVADESRIIQEAAFLAEKLDISEELTRLQGHIQHFRDSIDSPPNGKCQGRKLDFLIQECNREVNTLSSKIQDSDIQLYAIDCKLILEKIREQVQNIE